MESGRNQVQDRKETKILMKEEITLCQTPYIKVEAIKAEIEVMKVEIEAMKAANQKTFFAIGEAFGKMMDKGDPRQ